MPYESWIDEQIRLAQERGEFDDLPGAGRPIAGLHKSDPDWWIKAKLAREGVEPPRSEPLLLRDEVRDLPATLDDARTEAEAREVLEDLNRRIRSSRLRRHALPAQVVATVDVEAELDGWRDRRRPGRRG